MADNPDIFAARNDEEREIFAIEDLVFDTQLLIQKAMKAKGVSQKELAERLACTPAWVSQLLSTKGTNLTLKTVARIAYALGEKIVVDTEGKSKKKVEHKAQPLNGLLLSAIYAGARSKNWHNYTPVNDNCGPRRVVA